MMLSQVIEQTRQEIRHWTRPHWGFADVGDHWDDVDDYDEINEETYSYFRRFVDGLRLSDIADNALVLDICARTGNGSLYFHEHGRVGTAICADVSPRMGEICSQRLRDGGLERFAWIQIFDYSLPFADASFDAILCFETVEHFSMPERLVAELGRVIKPNGTMILTTPNVLWEPIHALAAITGLHHSEGPHRFIRFSRLRRMVVDGGFEVECEETTVAIPGGPPALIRLGEWIERTTRSWLMPWIGLRRVLICRRR